MLVCGSEETGRVVKTMAATWSGADEGAEGREEGVQEGLEDGPAAAGVRSTCGGSC